MTEVSTSREAFTRKEVSKYIRDKWGLNVSYHTLKGITHRGNSPKYAIIGRTAIYPKAEIDRWMEECLSRKKVVMLPQRG